MWVLGGVDRSTNQCFLIPCPNNQRGADVLLPLIQRWVLPGSIVYTDGCKNLDDVLIDFMFRSRFNATSGIEQIANTFNGYLTVLRAD
jgi:hypothetical protein